MDWLINWLIVWLIDWRAVCHFTDNDTINTLRANINYVGKIAPLLDKEIPGMDNWMHFAHKFGLSKEICDSLKPKETPSPTRALLEHIVQVDPGLTVKRFIEVLIKMERMDVVDALGKIICGNTYIKKC